MGMNRARTIRRDLCDSMTDLTPFKSLIKEKCGLFFDDSRQATLEEGLRTRISKTGIGSYPKYLDRLIFDNDEFNNLVNLLTINETYFFREPAHLELLAKRLVPLLRANKKSTEKIRILCAGCSTGEEPYSIVMTLMEEHGTAVRDLFSVVGADIDSDALLKAGSGVFNSYSFRGVPNNLRDKYFEPLKVKQYRIRDFVREQVEFRKLNLLGDTFPHALHGIDVIFYRNVSIYFEQETQKSIFMKLAGLLNEKGYLILSSTETLSHNIGVLSLVELDNLFIYHKNVELAVEDRRKTVPVKDKVVRCRNAETGQPGKVKDSVLKKELPSVPAKGVTGSKPGFERRDVSSLFDKALSLARDKKYSDSLDIINELISEEPSRTKAYMLKAGILINLKRMDEAERACMQGIEAEQWCLEGYLLLGLIAKIQGNDEAALKRFKEALYMQSSCWLAHFHLAEIYRSRDELERASREYMIVIKLLKNGDPGDNGLTFFPLSFPVQQITHLCNHNLSELKKRLQ